MYSTGSRIHAREFTMDPWSVMEPGRQIRNFFYFENKRACNNPLPKNVKADENRLSLLVYPRCLRGALDLSANALSKKCRESLQQTVISFTCGSRP